MQKRKKKKEKEKKTKQNFIGWRKSSQNFITVATVTTLWANSADDILTILFSYFTQNVGFYISCKLSPTETICMKCQILFPGENKKKDFKLSSAENFTMSAC